MSRELEGCFYDRVLSVRGKSVLQGDGRVRCEHVTSIHDQAPSGKHELQNERQNWPATPARDRLRDSLRFKIASIQTNLPTPFDPFFFLKIHASCDSWSPGVFAWRPKLRLSAQC